MPKIEVLSQDEIFANFKSIEEYQEFLNKQPKKRKCGRPKKDIQKQINYGYKIYNISEKTNLNFIR